MTGLTSPTGQKSSIQNDSKVQETAKYRGEDEANKHNLLYLRSVDEERQAPPLSTRPGYQEAQTASVEM